MIGLGLVRGVILKGLEDPNSEYANRFLLLFKEVRRRRWGAGTTRARAQTGSRRRKLPLFVGFEGPRRFQEKYFVRSQTRSCFVSSYIKKRPGVVYFGWEGVQAEKERFPGAEKNTGGPTVIPCRSGSPDRS